MTRTLLITALCMLVLTAANPVAAFEEKQPWTPEILWKLKSVGDPRLSPDGKWIAYLDFSGDAPPDPRSLFTGRGLEPMSLHIQPADAAAQPRMLCHSGAAWPSWSADSKKLLFVAYNDSGRCELAIYDLQAATTRRLSIGLNPIIMP
ncbi:MAG: PD40 domain-containing protein, partial [Candidatus Krumholzibacteria bacterium]|nr:PD40 domain-containing protein [Candidatus Krumholzibacteria bacterium]